LINFAKATRHAGCSDRWKSACFSGIKSIHATHQLRL